jgi:sulfur-oxidizing protein SoxZ
MVKPRIKIPETIQVGDVIEVKTLISHVMETGFRKETDGTLVPRNIITRLTAAYAGRTVFVADLSSGISANPYVAFFVRVTEPGSLELTWEGDHDFRAVEAVPLTIA